MSNEIWRLEVVLKDNQEPHLHVMPAFKDVQEAIDKANEILKKIDPETIETAKIVNYSLTAIGEIDPRTERVGAKHDPRYQKYQSTSIEGLIRDSILKISGNKIDIDKYIPEQFNKKAIK